MWRLDRHPNLHVPIAHLSQLSRTAVSALIPIQPAGDQMGGWVISDLDKLGQTTALNISDLYMGHNGHLGQSQIEHQTHFSLLMINKAEI